MTYFKVLSKDWNDSEDYENPEWDDVPKIEARSPEHAAEKWAEREDQRGDYTIINAGGHGPVKVYDCITKQVVICDITAESCPTYNARTLRTRNAVAKPDYYTSGTYKEGQDPEVTCETCKKTFLCDAMDSACRLCGEWFSAEYRKKYGSNRKVTQDDNNKGDK